VPCQLAMAPPHRPGAAGSCQPPGGPAMTTQAEGLTAVAALRAGSWGPLHPTTYPPLRAGRRNSTRLCVSGKPGPNPPQILCGNEPPPAAHSIDSANNPLRICPFAACP
jgi:hypothetical protein